MVIMRNGVRRRQATLSDEAIPLGNGSSGLICEVEATDNRAPLPTSVGRNRGPSEKRRAVRRVPDPLTAYRGRVDIQSHLVS